jgi:hypothetical protein
MKDSERALIDKLDRQRSSAGTNGISDGAKGVCNKHNLVSRLQADCPRNTQNLRSNEASGAKRGVPKIRGKTICTAFGGSCETEGAHR